MSCNHCTTKFNFFHKEIGCASCGLSFCNKCLKQKCRIPSKGASEQSVCRTCYQKLTGANSSTSGVTVITPPDAYLKRLEALDNQAAPITIYSNVNASTNANLRQGLAAQDVQILERLEKLKGHGKGPPPPSESEIRQRLAKLKGENEYVVGPSKLQPPQPPETADKLLEQFIVERDIELAHNPQEDIEARLASLREQGIRPNEGPFVKNLHDSGSSSEDEVEKITKKIMDEVALDSRCPVTLSGADREAGASDEDARGSPELPWCVLCNNDATLRCLDCGGDLYCAECSAEAHKSWGDSDHRVIPYERK